MSLIIVILIGLLILYLSQINYRKIYLSLKIPGPFPLPFVGNALYYFNKSSPDIYKISVKLANKYGDVLAMWVCSEFVVVFTNPEDIKRSKFIEKSDIYKYIKPWLNEGLLLSTGSKWFQRRKLLTPAFHFKVLEEYTNIFDRQSSVLVDILSTYKATDKIELFPLIGLCTLDVIGEAAMGIELNTQRKANSEYVKAVETISHIIHLCQLGCFLRSDIIFRLSKYYKQQQDALKILHGFTNRVIQERRQKLVAAQMKESSDDTASVESTKIYNFLDILLQGRIDGKPLSNLDIREEVDTLMLYPSVPIMGRLLHEELRIGDYTYPKGTSIPIAPNMIGRMPRLFPNPLEFRPERFLDDNTNEEYIFSYLPFSAGPRNCIGQRFAMLEVKALVSKVLRHFEITLADDSLSEPTLVAELTMSTEEKINYHLKPRLY